ncbi:MAG TPA: hypothetical protein VK945_01735 [Planococcus sp. (in: firmicutes)]|nr:hypothetical protein [Planococcus sp. (in: firmicutes)]
MKKWYLPIGITLLLSACSGEDSPALEEGAQTEVSAPEGDNLDPTDPEAVKDAEAALISDLAEGNIEDGTAVKISGTVDELADDIAFPSFILSSGDHKVYIRNMAETPVEIGDTIQVEGIYDGNAEEDMPLISASVITVE